MKELRARLLAYEKEHDIRLVCPTSKYKCYYCPRSLMGKCPKLEDFLETGEWK